MSNYRKTTLTDKHGRKTNVYAAASREEVGEEVIEALRAAGKEPGYMMCDGCDKPVIICQASWDASHKESASMSRIMVTWCIECLNQLAYQARFEGGFEEKGVGRA